MNEARKSFLAEAKQRLDDMARTGEYLTLDDFRDYASALARGERPAPPEPRLMSAEDLARLRASLGRAP